jgi:hypothetical protein
MQVGTRKKYKKDFKGASAVAKKYVLCAPALPVNWALHQFSAMPPAPGSPPPRFPGATTDRDPLII